MTLTEIVLAPLVLLLAGWAIWGAWRDTAGRDRPRAQRPRPRAAGRLRLRPRAAARPRPRPRTPAVVRPQWPDYGTAPSGRRLAPADATAAAAPARSTRTLAAVRLTYAPAPPDPARAPRQPVELAGAGVSASRAASLRVRMTLDQRAGPRRRAPSIEPTWRRHGVAAPRPVPTHDEIAARAYLMHLDTGTADTVANWLRAERELMARGPIAAATPLVQRAAVRTATPAPPLGATTATAPSRRPPIRVPDERDAVVIVRATGARPAADLAGRRWMRMGRTRGLRLSPRHPDAAGIAALFGEQSGQAGDRPR